MEELGLTPEEPITPTEYGYLVCYAKVADEKASGSPEIKIIYAALIGRAKGDETTQAADTEAQLEDKEGVVIIEEGGGPSKGDAASCDALKFVSFELVEGPIEETSDSGSYSCYLNYSLTNTHPSSKIVLSWKHDISSREAGPYWTHPDLGPGESYYAPLTLSSHMSAKGEWRTVDANYLMAWFATSECDYYKHDYWPTEEEPDKLLKAGFEWIEIENPCRR
jgi:hypothetical protein